MEGYKGNFIGLKNPDNIPGKVTSGYQRQNINILAVQTGIDTTEPYDNGAGVITIPPGGIVDLNGQMFVLAEQATLNKPVAANAYWVAVYDQADGTAKAALVTRPGAWDSDKQGCYLYDGARTLNWVSLGVLSSPPAAGAEYQSPAVKGLYEKQLTKGWKFIRLQSGKGGGDGANASGPTNNIAGSGGKAGISRSLDLIFFSNGKNINRIKIGASGLDGSDGINFFSGTEGSSGGGGSGGGEETCFNEFSTGNVNGGNGGSGGTLGPGAYYLYDNGGINGNNGGDISASHGGRGKGYLGGGGGGAGAASRTSGGNGGDGGNLLPNGSPGGYCNIYPIAE
ncbi:MAG: hypothetical protein LBH43_16395 [Treponema sp.]|jgi:hypothetical protein|nr:hypothetical protein [Treponema sp.]